MDRAETLAVFDEWAKEPPRAVVVKGKTFYVRNLTTAEVDRRIAATKEPWQEGLAITIGATAALCDEQGNLTFDPNNEKHVMAVGAVPWVRIQKIIAAFNAEEDNDQGN